MKIINLIWIFAVLTSVCYAQVDFYSGNIIVEKVIADIDLDEGIAVDYTLFNNFKKKENVVFDLSQKLDYSVFVDGKSAEIPVELHFEKGDRKTISVNYKLDVNGDKFKETSYNPKVLLDEGFYPRSVLFYDLTAALPLGINNLVNPLEGYSLSSENGRVTYHWQIEKVYLASLRFAWSTLDTNLDLVKEVEKEGDILNVVIRVENKGDNNLDNILLEDVFLPSKFEAISPADEFTYLAGRESEDIIDDDELLWNKVISLRAGESKTLMYSVKDLNADLGAVLNPTTAFVDDVLVATSNQVEIRGQGIVQLTIDNKAEEIEEEERETAKEEKESVLVAEESAVEKPADPFPEERINYVLYLLLLLLLTILVFIYLETRKK